MGMKRQHKCNYNTVTTALSSSSSWSSGEEELLNAGYPGFALNAIAAAAAVANLVTITFTIVSGQYLMYRGKYYHHIKAQHAWQTTASKIDAYIERNKVFCDILRSRM